MRYKNKKELIHLLSQDKMFLGQVIDDGNGTKLLIVGGIVRSDDNWACEAIIIETPSTVTMDFISPDLVPGSPVVFMDTMWVKRLSGDFILQYQGQLYHA